MEERKRFSANGTCTCFKLFCIASLFPIEAVSSEEIGIKAICLVGSLARIVQHVLDSLRKNEFWTESSESE